jgi:N-acylneuraminate cytidylyltransferase
MNTNYAFIFARGGSKGLVNKNIKILAGKPLIQYSIETALASPSISKVFVSTDDSEIADIALATGAKVINRPDSLATDDSPEWLSWRHAIKWVISKHGEFDGFISLPATSPLRNVNDVESSINRRILDQSDICISIAPASRSPYFNMVTVEDDGRVKLVINPKKQITRRQDAPQVYDITTVVYASTPEFILNHYGIFSGKVSSIVVPKERAVDIDDIYDFKLAEVIIQAEQ